MNKQPKHSKSAKAVHRKASHAHRAKKKNVNMRAKKTTKRPMPHKHTKSVKRYKVVKAHAPKTVGRIRVEKTVKEKVPKVVSDFRTANIADEMLINQVIEGAHFSNHISRNVGKRAREIIKILATPQTDDAIAEKLDIKINEVRRMLNTLNTFGVTRYNVNKDSKGWLTFKWYIDASKLIEMQDEIIAREGSAGYRIPEGCNDFFICNKCYAEQKTIFPFETAFEMNFKCECGGVMKQVNKIEVEQLVMQEGKIL
ncbi:MAG: hypothetical protein KGH61_00830 [Candidatus Micrarchaeota archaeon]|nr:hypothetical protein [Candidatus Micrarchaeota archaeon]MDE1847480.1 hypothetical protein [Candidatus Micrarchaeota archaeon]MDE1864025.1 hypothetical protein [Candidatus Micrarchaeota archaeon]